MIRGSFSGLVLASIMTAGIGMAAAPASAAVTSGPQLADRASYQVPGHWERAGEYSTWRECNDDGKLWGGRYTCELSVLNKWVLFIWIA
ncbi:hypothetical protein [Nonomuraea sp. SBT364]|uniref:hypothetical protein n=1 Tax=Nonomuraea sp. SBT364 TaxID=1580530 RepID=UPI00066CBFD0|nr:hypothetical protein [Nonomuraea sp. SBT364]